MDQNEISLKDIKKSIDEVNQKVTSLEKTNKHLIDIVHTNYSVLQTAFNHNDKSLKTIQNKNSRSIKVVYACIVLVLIMIGIIIGSMIKIHFIR